MRADRLLLVRKRSMGGRIGKRAMGGGMTNDRTDVMNYENVTIKHICTNLLIKGNKHVSTPALYTKK